jgi:biotin carboxyl carrier protein
MKFTVKVENRTYHVEVQDTAQRPIVVKVDGERFEVWPEQEIQTISPPKAEPAKMTPRPVAKPSLNGNTKAVYAPIPGVIQSVAVKAGDNVNVGQELCVLEAMKMKNIIRATKAGQIEAVHVSDGQQVKHHDVLVTYAG